MATFHRRSDRHDGQKYKFADPASPDMDNALTSNFWYSVATFFRVGSPRAHFALSEYAISDIEIQMMNREAGFHIITDRDGKFVTLGVERA